jgi:transposase
VDEFVDQVHQQTEGDEEPYVAILEVCGFHDWLVKRLQEDSRCQDTIVIQPIRRSRRKTDRRDANDLSELLWINRERMLRGDRVHGVRQVRLPNEREKQDRELTQMRDRLVRNRTQTLNRIHNILRQHNLEWERPTKTFQTKRVRQWLRSLELDTVEHLILDQLLVQWDLWDQQLEEMNRQIEQRFAENDDAALLATMHGVSQFMALAIACRIGSIDRFPRGRSLANFFGLTPSSNSSGDAQRLGSITKEGSRMVRYLLGQLVLNQLRRDGDLRKWYQQIKRRRGSKIARVAVMRRLTVVFWHMLKKRQAWQPGSRPQPKRRPDDPASACQSVDPKAVVAEYLKSAVAAGSAGTSTDSSPLSQGSEA